MSVYDDVPYDTEANADTHPGAIATLAALAGIASAPPSSARVLEIGCGNGENLIAAATYLPRACFVGLDLARTRADAIASPEAKVRAALDVIREIARLESEGGFPGAVARAASGYLEHVERATPPGAPFSRYVFHDLLADCNDPFSVPDLE